MSENAIHIHEDDWAMRTLHPLAADAEARAELAALERAGERNRSPSGFGWTDIHIIRSPSINYCDVGLALADAAAALAPIMPRVRRFAATIGMAIDTGKRDPFGSYQEEAWCYGLGDHCFLKLEPKGELVEQIWFDLHSRDPGDMAALGAAIRAVDALAPSILVDHWLSLAGRIGDAGFLDSYFPAYCERAEIAARATEEMIARMEKEPARPPAVPRKPG